MKKTAAFLLLIVFLPLFSACGKTAPAVILDNSEKSRFIDFYTEGGNACIECELNIYAESDATVSITAVDGDNVKTGLLKSPELTGVNVETGSSEFTLKKGENTVSVVFKGEYAGIPEIAKRDIPRFIKIEYAEK